MRREGAAARAVDRLDAAVAKAVAGVDEPILAFSGGLASLMVAALVRKRGDLRCVVVGLPGASDVEAAQVAHLFLDYPVSILRPTPTQALRAARSIAASDARLALSDVLALVPLALVEGRYSRRPVLSGFGLAARGAALRRALWPQRHRCPGLRSRAPAPTRAPLVRMAVDLGLPESFTLAAPRTPVEGSGIGPALRTLAHREGVSLPRLLGMPWTRF